MLELTKVSFTFYITYYFAIYYNYIQYNYYYFTYYVQELFFVSRSVSAAKLVCARL